MTPATREAFNGGPLILFLGIVLMVLWYLIVRRAHQPRRHRVCYSAKVGFFCSECGLVEADLGQSQPDMRWEACPGRAPAVQVAKCDRPGCTTAASWRTFRRDNHRVVPVCGDHLEEGLARGRYKII